MVRFVQAGVRWEALPEFQPHLAAVLAAPAQVLKESPAKLVTRQDWGGRTYYAKHYRHDSVPLRPFKFLFKSSQAHGEWKLAQQLEALGIPIVRHVALGERWSAGGLRESILITEGFAGVPLNEAARMDAAAVMDFVARLHARGVLQRDLHPGNILVGANPSDMRLVDLHGTIVKRMLTETERTANLACLGISVELPLSAEAKQLSARLRRELYAQRSRRCLKHNREFTPQRIGALCWQIRRPRLTAALQKIMGDPDGFLENCPRLLKRGRTATVGGADGLVLKRYNLRKFQNLFKNLFRPSPARRAYRKAYHLELAGIPTARPIAVADRRICRFLLRSYFVMEEIPGATDLGKWRGDLGRVAELIARLHEAGFSHRDLKHTNIVLDTGSQPFLIDLEGLRYLGCVPDQRAAKDLARLAEVVAENRARFVEEYCRQRGLLDKQRAFADAIQSYLR